MAAIKHEQKFEFPEGNVYVLMNDEWSVDVSGEQGVGGDLVGMGSWDFKTREAWEAWGNHVIERICEIHKQGLSPEEVNEQIYSLSNEMSDEIRSQEENQ